jgi:hypothetical protein
MALFLHFYRLGSHSQYRLMHDPHDIAAFKSDFPTLQILTRDITSSKST